MRRPGTTSRMRPATEARGGTRERSPPKIIGLALWSGMVPEMTPVRDPGSRLKARNNGAPGMTRLSKGTTGHDATAWADPN